MKKLVSVKEKVKRFCMIVLVLAITFSITPGSVFAAKTVKLNRTKATIYVGKKVQLKLINNKKKIKWSTSNKKIATVSKKGKVKGIKSGKATIIAKIGKNKFKCNIVVKKKKDQENIQFEEHPSYSVGIVNGLDISASYDKAVIRIYNYGNQDIYVGNPALNTDYILAHNVLAGSRIYQSNENGIFSITPSVVKPYSSISYTFSRFWRDRAMYAYYVTFHLTNATYYDVPIYSQDGVLHTERGYVSSGL